jgi:hypothetical protein
MSRSEWCHTSWHGCYPRTVPGAGCGVEGRDWWVIPTFRQSQLRTCLLINSGTSRRSQTQRLNLLKRVDICHHAKYWPLTLFSDRHVLALWLQRLASFSEGSRFESLATDNICRMKFCVRQFVRPSSVYFITEITKQVSSHPIHLGSLLVCCLKA